MLDRVISRESLLRLVDDLARSRQIVGPVRRGDHYFYERVSEASSLDLGFSYCVYGPKSVLLPPREVLFRFNRADGSFETQNVLDEAPTALIGVHPCDLNAIRLLDRVFSRTHVDPQYQRRRANTLLVGIDCPRPCTPGVFCADMKANEAGEGFDLLCFPLQDGAADDKLMYGVVFGTPAGRALVLEAQVGDRPLAAHERALERYRAAKQRAFPRRIPYDVDTLPKLLERSYDSLLWEATARRCYSCGSCNLSCPSCYCFNMVDEVDLSSRQGERFREWDGCQLRVFAEVAGGHNFRPQAASRLRHRIYRKAKWIREREGLPGCVGCARCDRACTAHINSVEIYRQLAEEG